jgi:hypothetical protein
MRAQKSKTGATVPDKLIKGWPDEIAQDVFELWIGISRLMARMGGSDRQFETTGCAGRQLANRSFAPRRKAK